MKLLDNCNSTQITTKKSLKSSPNTKNDIHMTREIKLKRFPPRISSVEPIIIYILPKPDLDKKMQKNKNRKSILNFHRSDDKGKEIRSFHNFYRYKY